MGAMATGSDYINTNNNFNASKHKYNGFNQTSFQSRHLSSTGSQTLALPKARRCRTNGRATQTEACQVYSDTEIQMIVQTACMEVRTELMKNLDSEVARRIDQRQSELDDVLRRIAEIESQANT